MYNYNYYAAIFTISIEFFPKSNIRGTVYNHMQCVSKLRLSLDFIFTLLCLFELRFLPLKVQAEINIYIPTISKS